MQMAQNFVQEGKTINAAATDPAAPASGDPVRVGEIAGVAVTAEGEGGNATGETTIATRGVFDLSVKGVDGVGDSAVAAGDKIYYVDADDPKLSKKDTGRLFGKALGAVTAGATATIPVLLIQA
jgi:predicted RecA/RadA family phage recombinase